MRFPLRERLPDGRRIRSSRSGGLVEAESRTACAETIRERSVALSLLGGREGRLKAELDQLFTTQNTSVAGAGTTIPATFLRVEVTR
jgi:hypothetical protein